MNKSEVWEIGSAAVQDILNANDHGGNLEFLGLWYSPEGEGGVSGLGHISSVSPMVMLGQLVEALLIGTDCTGAEAITAVTEAVRCYNEEQGTSMTARRPQTQLTLTPPQFNALNPSDNAELEELFVEVGDALAELTAQFDLARAYQEMGDEQGSWEILQDLRADMEDLDLVEPLQGDGCEHGTDGPDAPGAEWERNQAGGNIWDYWDNPPIPARDSGDDDERVIK